MAGTIYNAQSMVGVISGRPGVTSPGKDSRNIKLDPINMCKDNLLWTLLVVSLNFIFINFSSLRNYTIINFI